MATKRQMVPGIRSLATAIALALVACAGRAQAAPAAPPAPSGSSCGKCHKEAAADLAAHGGKHAGLGCADCHAGKHPPKGKDRFPECTGCHEGHGKTMTAADCARCHRAHSPRKVRYGLDVPSAMCGACHAKPLELLSATKSRHKPLRCSLCHQKEHGATKSCADCHGSPHAASAVVPTPGCTSCHGTAHDLGKPTGATAAAAGAPKK